MSDGWENEGGYIPSGSGGRVKDTPYGDIQIYREYKPATNRIEFTIFFRLTDGVKYCMDIDGSWDVWDRIISNSEGPGIEKFMYDTMAKLIEDRQYRKATSLFTVDGRDYKGYSID